MILMREINELTAKLLLRIYRQSRHHQVRQRAHCLLLLNQEHKKIKELMEIFDVSYSNLIQLDKELGFRRNGRTI